MLLYPALIGWKKPINSVGLERILLLRATNPNAAPRFFYFLEFHHRCINHVQRAQRGELSLAF
jgi:hypothetical protein